MKFLFFIFLFFASLITMAQNKTQSNSAEVAQNFYHQTINTKEAIYSGKEYFYNNGNLTGHVFWGDNVFIKGNVGFAGNFYPNLPLKLDLLNEELVTHGSNLSIQIKVTKEKIDSFQIGNTRFIRIIQNNTYKMLEGFYEILHEGKYNVVCRRVKTIKEIVSADGVEKKVEQKNNYYINDNGEYKEIKSRQMLYDFFKEKKERVLQYAKQENLNYNTDAETFILLSIKYYEQITN